MNNLQASLVDGRGRVRVTWQGDSQAQVYQVSVRSTSIQGGVLRLDTAEVTEPAYEFVGAAVTTFSIEVVAQGDGYRESEVASVEQMTQRIALPPPAATSVVATQSDDSIRLDLMASGDLRITDLCIEY